MTAKRTRWADLSRAERAVLLVMVAAEFALTSAAAVDLSFRARRDVRGRKTFWWAAILVPPVGPIAYLLLGRRHPGRHGPAGDSGGEVRPRRGRG